jgi:hypothetical protein
MRPSMTRECDERMWNLAYRLAQSGEHQNYQAIEWELRRLGILVRHNYYATSESVKSWMACAPKRGNGAPLSPDTTSTATRPPA